MRKLLFSALLICACSTVLRAQTTQDEYIYITRGLIRHYTEGADMRSGYTMEQIGDETRLNYPDGEWRSVTLYAFKKGVLTKAFIVACLDKSGGRSFKCIPANGTTDRQLWKDAFQEIQAMPAEWHTLLSWALAKVISLKMTY